MPDTLGEICTLQGGFAFKSKDFCSDGVPVAKIADVTGGTSMDYHAMQCIPFKIAETAERFQTQENDTLISMTGANVGKVTRVWPGEPMALINQRVGRFVPKEPEKYSKDFIHYLVSSHEAYEYFRNAAYGSAQPNISGKLIESLPLPDLGGNSPTEIGALLRALDDKIELNRKTAATLEEMARALYRSWFVDFDPVWARTESHASAHISEAIAALFPDSFGEDGLPEGWAMGSVVDVFDVVMGQSPPGHTYNDDGNGLPFYQGRTDFGFRFPVLRKFCSAPSRIAPYDSVLLSVRAPVGDLNRAWEKCCIGRGVASLSEKAGRNAYGYEAMWALSDALKTYDSEGTVFGSINKKQLAGLELVLPPDELRDAFEELVQPMDDRVRNITAENRTLATLRDTLLPKLMSGELRVPAAREIVEEAV